MVTTYPLFTSVVHILTPYHPPSHTLSNCIVHSLNLHLNPSLLTPLISRTICGGQQQRRLPHPLHPPLSEALRCPGGAYDHARNQWKAHRCSRRFVTPPSHSFIYTHSHTQTLTHSRNHSLICTHSDPTFVPCSVEKWCAGEIKVTIGGRSMVKSGKDKSGKDKDKDKADKDKSAAKDHKKSPKGQSNHPTNDNNTTITSNTNSIRHAKDNMHKTHQDTKLLAGVGGGGQRSNLGSAVGSAVVSLQSSVAHTPVHRYKNKNNNNTSPKNNTSHKNNTSPKNFTTTHHHLRTTYHPSPFSLLPSLRTHLDLPDQHPRSPCPIIAPYHPPFPAFPLLRAQMEKR